MSEVVIKADTKTKSISVTVDGNELPDFYSAMIYFNSKAASDNPYRMNLELCCMTEGDEDEGELRKMTRYCASQDGSLAVQDGVEKEIENYFSA